MPDISGTRSPLMFLPPQLTADVGARTPSFEHLSTPLDAHLDKLRIVDALTARDVAVHRLASACASVRAKESTIARLEREKDELKMSVDVLEKTTLSGGSSDVFTEQRGRLLDRIALLETTNRALRGEVEVLRAKQESVSVLNTPRFNEMAEQSLKVRFCHFWCRRVTYTCIYAGFSVH